MTARARATALAAAALLLYLSLGQNLFHGIDAYFYLRDVAEGRLLHSRSFFYLPLAAAWCRLLEVAGVPAYEALRALSAVGAAVGVFAVHQAALRLGVGAARAVQAAAGCALLPAVLHAATVVEVDAILFACAAVCFVPFARLVTQGGALPAAAVGLGTGVAAGFHAAGHLLAATLCCLQLAWSWPQRPPRRTAPGALLLLLVHAAITVAITLPTRNTMQATMAAYTLEHPFDPTFLGHVLWHEWLLPYAPLGLLTWLSLRQRALRGAAVATALCLCGYLYVTSLILGIQRFAAPHLPQGDIVERGTFLFGVAVPMVWLAVCSASARAVWTCIALTGLSGVVQVCRADWPPDPPGYAAGVAEVLRAGPIHVLAADMREWAWIARRQPEVPCTLVAEIAVLVEKHRTPGTELDPALLVVWFDLEYDRDTAAGRRLVVTDAAMAALRGSPHATLARGAPLLAARYEFEPVRAQAFSGSVLRRR